LGDPRETIAETYIGGHPCANQDGQIAVDDIVRRSDSRRWVFDGRAPRRRKGSTCKFAFASRLRDSLKIKWLWIGLVSAKRGDPGAQHLNWQGWARKQSRQRSRRPRRRIGWLRNNRQAYKALIVLVVS
jgi:hypothetical protein